MPLRGVTQKEELAQANARIAEFEGQVATATETISKLETAKTEISAQLENANAALVDLYDKNAKLETEKTETIRIVAALQADKAKLEGEAKSADERSREIAARTGTLLPKKDLKALETVAGEKTMSRADFSNLKHGERRAFIKGGGRLTD
jgi:chromosome segregation ATPase